MNEQKQLVLASFLECDPDCLEQINKNTFDKRQSFDCGGESYLVLDEDEVGEFTHNKIMEDLWAFNAEFILPRSNLEYNDNNKQEIIKNIKLIQEKLCEGANSFIRALIKDNCAFVVDATEADGRGHFLAGNDGEEKDYEYDGNRFFIYRQ